MEAAAPYELGAPPQLQVGTLYPAYIRGQAQLMAHNGSAAAAEFQKLLDHRGIVLNFPRVLWPISSLPAPMPSPATPPKRIRLSGFLHSLERRRPRHPHPEGSQGGVREAAVTFLTRHSWSRDNVSSASGVKACRLSAIIRDATREVAVNGKKPISHIEGALEEYGALPHMQTLVAAGCNRDEILAPMKLSTGPLGLLSTRLQS